MRQPFTGRHMAAVMVGGFGVIVAVNLLMATLASQTFGGLVVENSYVASQKFNGWLNEADKAASLGWKARASRGGDGRLEVETSGVPAGAVLRATLRHPLGREADTTLAFRADGEGRFISTMPAPAGRWIVRLEIEANGQVWRGERNVQ